ncbi:MAG: sigma-70 family RNA polymerase sigma factor [Dyadobacter sp.]|uniref:RNA polymerase sigma factor n=1 Tax=Dyadobacter sp. TaxID=1914288 RepID=UPI003264BD19
MKFLGIFRTRNPEPLPEAQRLSVYRQTGDVGLLGELYSSYMEMVFGICYKYLRDEDESKDAVMQIFEKLVQDLKTHEVGNFKSWLHSVARNHCLMQLRSKRVFVGNEEIKEEYAGPDLQNNESEDIFTLDHQLNSLGKCMQSLVSEQRVSIQLFYVEEKCYKDICIETGYDFNKVKSYIQNGKRNLKICMDRNGND